jgi:hypothetical protein
MDKATLVRMDVDSGPKVVDALDQSGLKVSVAVWAVLPEYEGPRLVLASPFFDESSPLKAYGIVLDALREREIATQEISPLLILRMKDPFIQSLRKLFAKAKSVNGMHLGGQTLGGRYLEDAYIYRIS